MFAIAIAYVIVWASIVNAENIKTVRVSAIVEDHVVVQDITDDPERNTVLIIVGEAGDFEELEPTVNLHDFNTGYVALKSVTKGDCLLKPLPENKREHIPGLNADPNDKEQKFINYQKTMYWYKHPKVLEYEEVESQAGKVLAEFCHDYKTYNLIPRNIKQRVLSRQSSEQTENRRTKRCSRWCGWCINEIDGFEDDLIDLDYKGN